MTDKDMMEYTAWMIKESATQMIYAVGIYAVALSAYWILVG
jgi:hypothetical protein